MKHIGQTEPPSIGMVVQPENSQDNSTRKIIGQHTQSFSHRRGECNPKHCVIKKIIGEGASSTVYKAFEIPTGRSFAVKVFDSIKQKEHEEMIFRHLQKSEHIVQHYGVSQSETHSFSLYFELCDSSLISFLNEHELDTRGIKKIMRMILTGIMRIHESGVIHRDIKLGNILIKGDTVKICDFGLSCFSTANDFRQCGTKDYQAPEMERGENYDEKVDIYAAGIIYKVLLTRKKDVEIESLPVDRNVKDLIQRLTDTSPIKRISAEEALKHISFDDLFVEIPDFRDLNTFTKVTKYGRMRKIDDHVEMTIEANNETEVLRVFITEKGHVVTLSNNPIEKYRMENTVMKHFNYLNTYVRMIGERTIKHSETLKDAVLTMTGCNTIIHERSGTKIVKRGNVFIKDQAPIDKGIVEERTLKEIEGFEKRCRNGRMTTETRILNETSMEEVYSSVLVKKYEYVRDIGWGIRNGSRVVLLMNNGRRMEIDVEAEWIETDGRRQRIEDMPVSTLIEMKKVLEKFIK